MQQQSELPEGWTECQINDIISINYGKGLKKSNRIEGKFHVFGSNGIIGKHNQSLTNGPTIIIGRKGSVGEINLSSEPCWPIDTTYYIDNFYGVNRLFLYNLLKTLNLANYDTSTAIPGINRNDIYSIEIPLPPLAEQHSIVSAIEALFARLDVANERLDRVPDILKKFRQSVLDAACNGSLTEEWRKEHPDVENLNEYLQEINKIREGCSKKDKIKFKTLSELNVSNLLELPDYWLWIPSNLIFSYVTSGSRGWAKYYSDTGPMFIRIGNLDRNSIYLNLENVQRVSPPDNSEGRRTRIQQNDILISITADIGSIGYICEDIGDAYINQHIALARPVQILNPKYIAFFLHSQTGGKKQFEKKHRGAIKIGLGLDDIRSIAIPLPPLPEQHEIVRRVDALFALADSIEAKVTAARERTEKLRQSVLTKAFSGELVETEAELARREGRDYEPADVLLERIRAEHGKSGKKGKAAKGKSTHLNKQ